MLILILLDFLLNLFIFSISQHLPLPLRHRFISLHLRHHHINHFPNNKHDSQIRCNSSVGPKPVPGIHGSNDFFVQAFGRIFVGKQNTDDPCNNEEKIDFPDVLSVGLFGFFNQIQRLYQIGLLALDSSVCLSQKFLKFMKFIISL